MRTLKALVCLSALAGGLATSVAADVYSLNIVGYYNVPTPGGLTAMTASLKTGANRADQVIPYADGDNIQVWSGVSWVQYTMDSASGTGWADSGGSDVPLANLPVLSPGKGFFYGKGTATANVTFVGEVPTGTNTISLGTGLNAAGSPIPYAGKVSTGPINLTLPDGLANVQIWSGVKWLLSSPDSASSTGWADAGGGEVAEPSVSVGQGFFVGNDSGAPIIWTQILNP